MWGKGFAAKTFKKERGGREEGRKGGREEGRRGGGEEGRRRRTERKGDSPQMIDDMLNPVTARMKSLRKPRMLKLSDVEWQHRHSSILLLYLSR